MATPDIICGICGKKIVIGSRKDGLPDAVNFMTGTGHKTVCSDCLIEEGKKEMRKGVYNDTDGSYYN